MRCLHKMPAFLDSRIVLNRKLKQGSVVWCSFKGGQSAVLRWACSFRVRQAARTDHRIGDTELRMASGRSENLGGACRSYKGKGPHCFYICQNLNHRIGDTEIHRVGGTRGARVQAKTLITIPKF